ncbi:MAG: DNA repair protein RecO [Parcubacteria group bacterium]|nr:DNA repair protein RecO [Parcubacteria group bacterium]
MTYHVDALILRTRNVGEADELITLFTREKGKQTIRAKGIRKIKSKLRGNLEPVSHVRLGLAKGRSFDVVTEAKMTDRFSTIKAQPRLYGLAAKAIELTDVLTFEHEKDRAIYELLLYTLKALTRSSVPSSAVVLPPPPAYSESDTRLILAAFEIQLLKLLGYDPHLRRCVVCNQEVTPRASLLFDERSGGIVGSECRSHATSEITLTTAKFVNLSSERPAVAWGARITPMPAVEEVERVVNALRRRFTEKGNMKSERYLDSLT